MFATPRHRDGRLREPTGPITTLAAGRLGLSLAAALARTILPSSLNRSITRRITLNLAESMPEMAGPSA